MKRRKIRRRNRRFGRRRNRRVSSRYRVSRGGIRL